VFGDNGETGTGLESFQADGETQFDNELNEAMYRFKKVPAPVLSRRLPDWTVSEVLA